MRKQALAALALLGATMGMSATPQSAPTESRQSPMKSQKHNDGLVNNQIMYRRGPVTPLNPAGLMQYEFENSGRSPKVYGQWLQSTGRQKWVKAKKR